MTARDADQIASLAVDLGPGPVLSQLAAHLHAEWQRCLRASAELRKDADHYNLSAYYCRKAADQFRQPSEAAVKALAAHRAQEQSA